jgi:hypothetical protein
MDDEPERRPGERYRASPYDRQRVKDLLASHVKLERIADTIGCSYAALHRCYGKEITEAGHRNVQGHNPTDKDRQMVELMTAVGISPADIALTLKISEGVLKRHYAEEITLGSIRANTKVGANMYRAATGDITKPATVTAGIWWSKNRMGWADKNDINATIRKDPNELSDAELERIARRSSDSLAIEAEGEEQL